MGWFRRTPRAPGPVRWWRAELARKQTDVIQTRVELELARLKLDLRLRPAGPEDFEALRQLDLHLSAVKQARADLDQLPSKKRRLLDRLVVRLWDWSTKGKFEPRDEKVEPRDPIAVC